jgi:hypothetical protein
VGGGIPAEAGKATSIKRQDSKSLEFVTSNKQIVFFNSPNKVITSQVYRRLRQPKKGIPAVAAVISGLEHFQGGRESGGQFFKRLAPFDATSNEGNEAPDLTRIQATK